MALENTKGAPLKLTKPIGLFSLSMENQFKPSHQPKVEWIEAKAAPSGNGKKFNPEKVYREEAKKCKEYLISIELDPGSYELGEVFGFAGDGFFISGHFKFPLGARFSLESGTVTYLGHVNMVNRKRKEGEPRSGSLLPLVDQAVTGFYSGTFDITVADQSETDIPAFVAEYPSLRGIDIKKAVMQK